MYENKLNFIYIKLISKLSILHFIEKTTKNNDLLNALLERKGTTILVEYIYFYGLLSSCQQFSYVYFVVYNTNKNIT